MFEKKKKRDRKKERQRDRDREKERKRERKERKKRKKRKKKKLGDGSDCDRKSVCLEVVLMGRDFRAPEDDDLSQRVAGSVLWAAAV